MDTEKCRALVAVVETGNIRKTADDLGYSPSGLSRMMASLERELGCTLLVRGRSGVQPTRECRDLLPNLRRVAAAGDACRAAARALQGLESGTVTLGIAYPQFYPALTAALAGFKESHPGVQVSLRESNTTPLVAGLETGEIDFAIMSKRPGSFVWHPLVDDTLVALVPATHPLAHAKNYPLERFAADPYIEIGPGENTDNALAFARYGIRPNVRYQVSLDSAGYRMVSAGLGVTLTNAIHAASHTDKGRVSALPTQPRIPVSIGVAHVPEELASSAARAFTAYALPHLQASARSASEAESGVSPSVL